MQLAPIALFVYNRLWHLQQTIESLKSNKLAKDSELFVFSDAARDKESEGDVRAVRDYLKKVAGFRSVAVNEFEDNLGPSKAIIRGVTDVINKYGKVIVLEDDLFVFPHFLKYMNDALLFYENEDKVISICAYMYPIEIRKQATVLLKITDCWGWATWKRGWELFEPDANKLLERLKARNLTRKFNLNGGYDYLKTLKKQSKNKISSWAICWYAASLLNDKLSLYPARSLVRNIGFDELGTHCSHSAAYDVDTFQSEVHVSGIPLEEDRDTINKMELFLKINQFKKIGDTIRKALLSFLRKRRNKTCSL